VATITNSTCGWQANLVESEKESSKMKTDKYTKIVLTLIALGMWMIVLKPMIATLPAYAQNNKKYEFVVESNGKMQIGGSGNLTLSSEEMRTGIRLATSQGWRVHSFTTRYFQGDTHFVLLEK
jgi:hypothetical protein